MIINWLAGKIHSYKKASITELSSKLNEKFIRTRFTIEKERERIYTSWVVFQMFFEQVINGHVCRQAVERAVHQGLIPPGVSTRTSAYCQARQKLSETALKELCFEQGRELEKRVPKAERFYGMGVKVVDGTSFLLPDTPENQKIYPQHVSQKEGLGYPVMHVCGIMELGSGSMTDLVEGKGPGFERPMFRELWKNLETGDLVLGDAGFGSYAEMSLLLERGIHSVFRQKHRKFDFKTAKSIGNDDWIITLKKPRYPGEWVEDEALASTFTVRVIRFNHGINGFRSQNITLMTTLLDNQEYPKHAFMDLYHRRWEIELSFRDIKTTMGLERLSSLTPEGCRKELWMGLLAYNIIRSIMLEASMIHKCPLACISFKGTLQRLEEFRNGILSYYDPFGAYQTLLKRIAQDKLPYRPHRSEPRAIKRRPKPFPLLTIPRHTWYLQVFNA